MIKEFKAFLMRGNVLDLAIGIVIGAAFGKIVSSFVNDILMPPLGLLMGKVDFSNLFIDLSGNGYNTLVQAKQAGAPTINYGVFINNVIDFVIVGFAVFVVIKAVNQLNKKEVPPPAQPTLSPELVALNDIRDILRLALNQKSQN